jgi:hypothetical protein
MSRFAALTALAFVATAFPGGASGQTAVSYFRAAMLDKPPQQIDLDTRFVEVSLNFRDFINWKAVSGDNPAVVKHDVTATSLGVSTQLGFRFGEKPLWGVVGGHYDTGLETSTELSNGQTVHSEVDSYGVGVGLRTAPYRLVDLLFFAWAMGYLDWNNGDFDYDAGDYVENRKLRSVTGDYGVGVLYLLNRTTGIDFGIGYNGQFKKKNADENVRVFLGVYLNRPDRLF